MGCGASVPCSEGAASSSPDSGMPRRAPIARRFDEIRRLRMPHHRRWNIISRAVSEKQLLVNKGQCDHDDEHTEDDRASSKGDDEEKMVSSTTVNGTSNCHRRKSHSDPEELRVAVREIGGDGDGGGEGKREEEEEEEEEEGSMIRAGSPSFRDYCVGSSAFSPSGSAKSGDHENEDVSQPKETVVEGSTADEVVVKSTTEQRGRRFKMVLPKQMAVKTLMNVTSCYNPPSSTAHDKLKPT